MAAAVSARASKAATAVAGNARASAEVNRRGPQPVQTLRWIRTFSESSSRPQHRIVGELTLPREGYRSRISDFLNQSDLAFIPLSNVTIIGPHPVGAPDRIEREFIAVGSAHVQLAYPED